MIQLLRRLLLALPGFQSTCRFLTRRHVRVLMYHRFSERPTADPDLVDQESLRRQVAYILRHHPVISTTNHVTAAAELLRHADAPVVITIDDGYEDFFHHAFPIFREHRLPVTLFPTTAFVDGRQWMWWDRLEYVLENAPDGRWVASHDAGPIEIDLRSATRRTRSYRELTDRCRVLADEERRALLGEVERVLEANVPDRPVPRYRAVDWDQLASMVADGLDVGGHTVHHPILSRLAPDEARREIEECGRIIAEKTGVHPDVFCYPQGGQIDISPGVVEQVKASGFLGAYVVDQSPDDRWDLFRISRSGVSRDFVRLRWTLCGAERIVSTVKRWYSFLLTGPRDEDDSIPAVIRSPRASTGLAGRARSPRQRQADLIARCLLDIASPRPDVRQIAESMDAIRDWEAAFQAAGRHNLETPLAWHGMNHAASDQVPRRARERMRWLQFQSFIRDSLQVMTLTELLDALRSASVPTLLLKGHSLSERLYGDPAERSSRDIDLLVPRDSLRTVDRTMRHLGYYDVNREYYEQNHFHILYVKMRGAVQVNVEIHWDVSPANSPIRFNVDRWWSMARPQPVRSGEALVLPIEIELPYLAWHAMNRGAIALRDLSDIARAWLIGRNAVRIKSIQAEAVRSGSQHFLYEALRLSDHFWDTGSPHELFGRSERPSRRLLSQDMLTAGAVLKAGKHRHSAYSRICYWSLLPEDRVGPGFLVSDTIHDYEHTVLLEQQRFSTRGAMWEIGRVALAVAHCLARRADRTSEPGIAE